MGGAVSCKSYAKGYRFEKRVQAWLAHLGLCERSFGSRGSDLHLTRMFKRWKVSCKYRTRNSTTPKFSLTRLTEELEKHDLIVWGEDRMVPYVAMPLPKLVQLCIDIEASADEFLGNQERAGGADITFPQEAGESGNETASPPQPDQRRG
jgi:hypothetical protein